MTDFYSAKHWAEKARKQAVGTIEEAQNGSAKHWADEARETAYSVGNPANHNLSNLTEAGEKKLIQPQSLYQLHAVLDTAAIILQEKGCRYERVVAANDDFTIDTSALNQQKDITFELILKMPEAVSFSLEQIVPLGAGETADNNKKWMGGAAPDLSEPGEHWVAFTSHDSGQTWRASYEGLFLL